MKLPYNVKIEGKNYLVSSICTHAFYNRDITSVVIPESVRFVAGHSFRNCKNLETVIIKEGFVRIMTEAFDEGVELIILKKENNMLEEYRPKTNNTSPMVSVQDEKVKTLLERHADKGVLSCLILKK